MKNSKPRLSAMAGAVLALATTIFSINTSAENSEVSKVSKTWPVPVAFSDQNPGGELAVRLQQSFNRMEEEKYQPHKVFLTNEESGWWPGDTEGRTVLALDLLAQAAHREPQYLSRILELFPEKMNKLGYFGDIPKEGTADEQQLSSHGWVLRGLCEYYLWREDPKVLAMIETVARNLVMSTKGLHSQYLIDPDKRKHAGSYMGEREAKQSGPWILSSDTGCDFIFLDGVTAAYDILEWPELKEVIDEMVQVYLKVDLAAIKAQTHASLTGLRALSRYYEHTGDEKLVDVIQDRFDLYMREGVTENYENYNWFGRPTHTEPCAIIDSFIVAVNLWRYTGDTTYLEHAHHIYFNGIAGTQRANGGFGCNNCSGADDPTLFVKMQEAHWCCTMRGGEGLSRAAEYAYFTQGNTVTVPFYATNAAKLRLADGTVEVEQSSGYPFQGVARIRVLKSDVSSPVTLRLLAPSFTAGHSVLVNGESVVPELKDGFLVLEGTPQAGDVVEVTFDLVARWAEPVNVHTTPGFRSLRYGPLVLAREMDTEDTMALPDSADVGLVNGHLFELGGVELQPVYQLLDPEFRAEGKKLQVLFPEGKK